MSSRKFKVTFEGKENLIEVSNSNVSSEFKLEIDSTVKDKIKLEMDDGIYELKVEEIVQQETVQKPSVTELKEVKAEEIDIKAPMRGTVTKILVNPGDKLGKGDVVIILEAMKMENQIESPSSGTVKQVRVSVGDKVAVGESLVSLESG